MIGVTTVLNQFTDTDGILNILPEDYRLLFLSDEGQLSFPDIPRFLSFLLSEIFDKMKTGGIGLGALLATVILCGIFSSFESCTEKGTGKGPLKLCIFISGALALSSVLSFALPQATEHLNTLCRFLSSLLPVLTTILVSMGGLHQAAVASSCFSLICGIIGQFITSLLFPLLKASFMFEVCGVICENKGLESFSSTVRKAYTVLLGLITTVMLTLFSFQNVIAAKSDSLALRAFRYTAGNMIPVVGQTVSESSKTLLAGMDLLRTQAGGIAISVILLMLLPLFFRLLIARFTVDIAVSAAKASDNQLLASLLSCGSSLLGGICGLIALSNLLAILSLAVFMLSTGGIS